MKMPAGLARALSVLAALLVLGALGAVGWQGYRYLASRPVQHVAFEGDVRRVAPADLRALAEGVKGMTSMEEMRARARQVPWVRDASVRRDFPDGVEIQLDAYDAIARWGDAALLSSRGEIFRAPLDGTLTRVRAPDAMAPLLAKQLVEVQNSVKPMASAITEIAVNPRGAWRLFMASGLVLEVGRADVASRLARFAAAWPQLAAAGTETVHADLRYANGFALRRAALQSALNSAPALAAGHSKRSVRKP
jgi:cell division protein FtsQ